MRKKHIEVKCKSTGIGRKIAIIKDFAEKMGYTAEVFEDDYCRGVKLIGTKDSEGYPFTWSWDTRTGREL